MNPPAALRAVSFDVGGTLITPHPSVGDIYAEVAASHGFPNLPPPLLTQRFTAAWKSTPNFDYSTQGWAALVDDTFRGLLPSPPSQTFFPALYQRFAEPGAWHVYPDVLPTLQALGQVGLSLAIVSNWDARLRPLLRDLQLDRFFQVIVVSCEIGSTKPQRPIFDHLLSHLRLPANAVLHVGDHPEADLAGARNAGLRALLIDRQNPPSSHRLRRLTDLPVLSNKKHFY